ncbi:MAG: PAS domain S-box protein [Bacteroidales bacterium]|nr:PAS domain S-box protein [Bacteroidales bacterium]
MKKKIIPLDTVTDALDNIRFGDLFDIDEFQHLQDLFSEACGVASIITHIDGTPITKPSNFCRLCSNVIRKTEKGLINCFKSDAIIGRENPNGPIIQACLSGGLWDAGVSITVGGKHIANWLIGQVKNEALDEKQMLQYADEIGVNRDVYMQALAEVPVMSLEQFTKVSKMLFVFAKELSENAYSNLQLKTQIVEKENITKQLKASEERFTQLFDKAPLGYQSLDFDGNFIEVNQQWLDILGYSHEEVIGTWFGDYLAPEYRDSFRERFPIFKAKGKIHSEFIMVHKNGNRLFIAFDGKIGYDLDGKFKQTHCILQDISERRQAEEKLAQAALEWQTTFNAVDDAIWQLDKEQLIVHSNNKLEHFSKHNISEISHKHCWEIFHGTAEPIHECPFLRSKVSHKRESMDLKIDDKWYNISVDPIIDEDDQFSGAVHIVSNITERKRAQLLEHALYQIARVPETAKGLDELYYAVHQIIKSFMPADNFYVALYDDVKNIIYFPYFVDEVDKPPPALTLEKGLTASVIKTGHSLLFDGNLQKEKVINGEIVMLGTQSACWLGAPLKNGEKVIGVIAVQHYSNTKAYGEQEKQILDFVSDQIANTIERKKAEEALIQSELLLRESQKVARLGSYVWDIKIGIWKSSEILDEIFGIDESYNRTLNGWLELIHPDWRSLINNYISIDVLENHQLFNKEYMIVRWLDKKERWVHGLGELEYDLNGNPIKLYGTILDITERKQAELIIKEKNEEISLQNEELRQLNEELYEINRELVVAKEKAEESDKLKSTFLANISHEIRTPMNGILGFAELLKNPHLSGEKHQEFLDIIENSGIRMLNIINDLIDISKIESGQMKVVISKCNINEQIEYIYSFFKPEVEVKKLKLIVRIALPASKAIINTDVEKVYAIMINLVKNAIKYTNQGTIEFGYEKMDNYLEFYVKDTGIGIPKDRIEAIFERFIQADIFDSKALQGAGLGLAITKSYVEMLGGKIWVESTLGVGSTFFFTIPYITEPVEEIQTKKVSSKNGKGNQINKLKILIVEDDQTSELLLTLTFEKFKFETLNARTGFEAVKICRNNPDIDLILMDIRIPEINGFEVTKQIRKFNKKVIIIAQTAFALAGDGDLAIKSGCNDYIAKPIKMDKLMELLNKYFN